MLRVVMQGASVALTCILMIGCGQNESPVPTRTPPAAAAAAANAAWPRFVQDFIEAYFSANPTFAVKAGRHEFDGRLPDWRSSAIEQEIQRLEALRRRAQTFEDATMLPTHRFQRDYLISVIDRDLFWLRDARFPYRNPIYYFEHGLDPSTYATVPYAPAEQRLGAFVRYLEALPGALSAIRETLQPPLPRTYVDYAIDACEGFAEFFRGDAVVVFADVSNAQLQAELASAADTAAKAMLEMRAWFESLRGTATEAYALGPERFARMLATTERVTVSLERLEQAGQAELERNRAALVEACARFLPGETVEACAATVSADKPQPGSVEGVRHQLPILKQFVVERDIVSVPDADEVRVAEAPPYRRQQFAYLAIPGPFDKGMPAIYYIAPPDPQWSSAMQAAYLPGQADLMFTTVHEVWPGHFLHSLHASRVQWRFGQLFVSSAFAEGWAHYAEELMIEKGLATDVPALHIGQLLNALARNVQYLCAIGLHTEEMRLEECERMFREQAYQDAVSARRRAARGTYDPAYLSHTLGKLMIRKLRADWTAPRGGEKAWKAFHDQLLSYGSPPLPLVRTYMLRTGKEQIL